MNIYSDFIFPRMFDTVVRHQGFELSRHSLLARVRGRILELGIGTGLNLDHYPRWVKHITAVEPNPGMIERLEKRASGHRVSVDCRMTQAEDLPFTAGSFDTVISSLTLCSVGDLQKALMEVRRVLAPGGQFIFMDHGLSPEPRIAMTQKMLNPLQKLIGCGCQLTVDVEDEIRRAGFKIQELQSHYVGTGPKFLGHLYEGVAMAHSARPGPLIPSTDD